jgi:hypothetical protein
LDYVPPVEIPHLEPCADVQMLDTNAAPGVVEGVVCVQQPTPPFSEGGVAVSGYRVTLALINNSPEGEEQEGEEEGAARLGSNPLTLIFPSASFEDMSQPLHLRGYPTEAECRTALGPLRRCCGEEAECSGSWSCQPVFDPWYANTARCVALSPVFDVDSVRAHTPLTSPPPHLSPLTSHTRRWRERLKGKKICFREVGEVEEDALRALRAWRALRAGGLRVWRVK